MSWDNPETQYIDEKDLKSYYLIRTKNKPHRYRVGAKKQRVPKLYLLGSAKSILKEDEEIINLDIYCNKESKIVKLDKNNTLTIK